MPYTALICTFWISGDGLPFWSWGSWDLWRSSCKKYRERLWMKHNSTVRDCNRISWTPRVDGCFKWLIPCWNPWRSHNLPFYIYWLRRSTIHIPCMIIRITGRRLGERRSDHLDRMRCRWQSLPGSSGRIMSLDLPGSRLLPLWWCLGRWRCGLAGQPCILSSFRWFVTHWLKSSRS